MPAYDTIIVRQGTSGQWISANPTLYSGEWGLETDTSKYKIGNGSSNWTSLPYAGTIGSTYIYESLGDGSDGPVTFASGTVTLTRDMYYTNMTFTGGKLVTNGYKVFWTGVLDISSASAVAGSISLNGNNGTASTSATGAVGGAALTGVTVGGGNAGGTGATSTAAAAGVEAAAPTALAVGNGGAGGAGGLGGTGSSGAGGAARAGAAVTNSLPIRRYETQILRGIVLIGGGAGGAGGSSGGGSAGAAGGGGGGGGSGAGVIYLCGNIINRSSSTPADCIQANGGTGGAGFSATGTTVGGGAGGGGGGGGWVFLLYQYLTNSFIFTITSSSVSAGAIYSNNGQIFYVTTAISPGTTLTTVGTGAPLTSGTLLLQSGTGPTTITYSSETGTVAVATNAIQAAGGTGGAGGNGTDTGAHGGAGGSGGLIYALQILTGTVYINSAGSAGSAGGANSGTTGGSGGAGNNLQASL
jgi:Major tropism determinant N-terminal domain